MLAETLKAHREAKQAAVKNCIVQGWANSLDEEDISHFYDALGDNTISTRTLHQIFRKAGASFSLEALRKHRTEVCPCQI